MYIFEPTILLPGIHPKVTGQRDTYRQTDNRQLTQTDRQKDRRWGDRQTDTATEHWDISGSYSLIQHYMNKSSQQSHVGQNGWVHRQFSQ